MLSVVYKVILWILPRIIASAVDAVSAGLMAVAQAEQISDTDKRFYLVYDAMNGKTGGVLPSVVVSFMVDAILTMYRLGITPERVEDVQKILGSCPIDILLTQAKRREMLGNLALIFPDLPQRAIGILYDFAVLRIKGSG